jgi:hypothetical protein
LGAVERNRRTWGSALFHPSERSPRGDAGSRQLKPRGVEARKALTVFISYSLVKCARLNARLSGWRRRRGTATTPRAGGGLRFSGTEIAAIVIVALIAIGGIGYAAVYDKPKTSYFGVTITVQIYGAIDNSTGPGVCCTIPASYDPLNFTAVKGEHITLNVQNTDNLTHGLAVPKYNLDTGPLKPNGTATLSFVTNQIGNFTYDEPSVDCGGGNCDAGQAMSGYFLVTATA